MNTHLHTQYQSLATSETIGFKRRLLWLTMVMVLPAVQFLTGLSHAVAGEVPSADEKPLMIRIPHSALEQLDLEAKSVFLKLNEFRELWTKAKAQRETNQAPILTRATYEASLQEKLLKITGTYEVRSKSNRWQTLTLPVKNMAVVSATINDEPALLGKSETGPVLFLKEEGAHSLKIEYAVPIRPGGSDQVMIFSLPPVASGQMKIILPAGKRLLANTQMLSSTTTEEGQQQYLFPIGNQSDWTLRVTEKNEDAEQDRLFLASSVFTVYARAAEISWTGTTQLEVYGQPLDVVTCSVPSHLEVMSVTSTGLDSWDLQEDPLNPKRTQIKLSYRQGITGKREVTIQGVTTADTEGRWLFPNLVVNSADSQWGEITLGYTAPWKVRVETMEGVRRKIGVGQAESRPSRFDRALDFDVWRPDFELRFMNETTKSSYHAALASVLAIEEQGVSFQSQITLEATGTELFNFEFTLPANWEIESIQSGDQALVWKTLMSEPGEQRIQVPLNTVLLPGGTSSLQIKANLVDWILQDESVITLPQIELAEADLVEGTLVIQAEERFNVQHLNSSALEPIIFGLPNERLSYRFHEGEYDGEISVESKPALVVAQTTSLARLEKKELIANHEVLLDVSHAPIYSLIISVTELEDNNLQFSLAGSNIRVTAELLGEDQAAAQETPGEQSHTWRLGFSQPLQGEHLLTFETRRPRKVDETTFNLPEIRFDHVDRQYGTLLVEAEPEQRIATTAINSVNQPLPEQSLTNIALVNLQFTSRLVHAYSYVRKGYRWSISEERFDRSGLAVAFCDEANITSLLTNTGEFQHELNYKFRAANSQSLLLQFAHQNIELWSALLNGEPVPVRKSEQGFHISLPLDKAPGESQSLRLLYSRPLAELASTSRVEETPPMMYVLDGAGEIQEMIMVSQLWTLNYPSEKSLVESDGSFHPEISLEDWRGHWLNNGLQQIKSDFWWRGLMLLGFMVAVNVLLIVTRMFITNWRGTLLLGSLLAVLGFMVILMTTFDGCDSGVRYSRNLDDFTQGSESIDWNSPNNRNKEIMHLKNLAKGEDENKRQRALKRLGEMDLDLDEIEDASVRHDSEIYEAEDVLIDSDIELAIQGRSKDDPFGVTQTNQPVAKESKQKSRLSVSMSLPSTQGMNQTQFEYYGSGQAGLSLVFRDQQHDQAVTFCLFAAVLLLFWAFHRVTLATFAKFVLLAFFVPLALLWLVPVIWFPWLVGTMLGAVAALCLKLASMCTTWCLVHCCRPDWKKSVATGMLIALVCSSNVMAQEQSGPNQSAQQQVIAPDTQQQRNAQQRANIQRQKEVQPQSSETIKPTPPVNLLTRPNSFLFLYDKDYKQTNTVILRPDQHRRLWEEAYQSVPGQKAKLPEPIVASAGYTADLSQVADNKTFSLTGRIVVFAFSDESAEVQLPFKNMTLNSATLNGEPAELESRLNKEEQEYWLHLHEPGMQIVEVNLQIPVKQQEQSGQFKVNLLPVASGLMSVTLPQKDLQVSVGGIFLPFREQQQDAAVLVEQPISTGGDLEFKWQPKANREDTSSIVHAESVVDIHLTESGANISHRTNLRVRRGTLNQVTFALPEGVKVREITGTDVGGWSIQDQEGAQQLEVLFRRSVNNSTDLNVELYQPVTPGDVEGTLTLNRLGIQNLNRSTGTIAVHAPQHLSLKTNQLENLNQINPTDLPHHHQNSTGQKLAFRYHSVPYVLSLSVWQKETTTEVDAMHSVFIERQTIQYSSKFHIKISGEPLLHLEFELPENYLPMEVLANQLDDWYIEREEGVLPQLILEFTEPQQGGFEVAFSGKILKDISSQEISLSVPSAVAMDRQQSEVGVWFSEYYSPRLKEQGDWKTEAVNQLHSSVKQQRKEPPRFAFHSPRGITKPIQFEIKRTQAQMTANAVTVTNVSDTSLAYTLALKWSITHGGADQFAFTVPEWLQGKLELNGTGIRQAVEEEAEEGRVRWVIETQRLHQTEYFLTALATLELPAEGTFPIPIVEFETAHKQLGEVQHVPFELSQNDSIVVNQSQAHVKQTSGETTPIQKEQLPIIIDGRFLDQAVAIQRLNPSTEQPVWEINWSKQFQSAPAQVLLADIVTTLARDGSVRGQVTYTMRNNARQHLAIEVPESVRLLSILVGGTPTRAVEGKINGASVKLIPLPKQSEFGLSYPIQVTFESNQITQGFLHEFQFFSRKIDIPVPLVVGLSQSEEWGIPVLHTQWSVFAPENYDINYETGVDKTNLSESIDSNRAYQLAVLEEARLYLKSIKQFGSSAPRSSLSDDRLGKDLHELQSRIQNAKQELNLGYKLSGKLSSDEEMLRQKLDSDLENVQQELQTELSQEEASQTEGVGKGYIINRDVSQRNYLYEMNDNLILDNGISGVELDGVNESGMGIEKESDIFIVHIDPTINQDSQNGQRQEEQKKEQEISKSSSARGTQSGRSLSSAQQLARSNSLGKKSKADSSKEISDFTIKDNLSKSNDKGAVTNEADGTLYGQSPFPSYAAPSSDRNRNGVENILDLPSLDSWPSSGTIAGLSQPGQFTSESAPSSELLDVTLGIKPPSRFYSKKQTATLSLPVSIPRHGQRLDFMKTGGRPKLILTTRSERIWTTLLAILLAVVALLAGAICYRYFVSRREFTTGGLLLLYLIGVVCLLLGTSELMLLGLILLFLGLLIHLARKSFLRFQQTVN
ncbi:hypothetical protein Pla110_32810 [Polystyrenella longa]|uniref:Uncharacterized protein n=1 Tax=Polystyrenella longa TaxID=2528007 RepID=A0A518CQN7_9PLAN|nr:Yip1 family protein [Polystyrenella longa]QDU81539.1 hypothetical protein Pla110_32810 [Polystyrenella longa]